MKKKVLSYLESDLCKSIMINIGVVLFCLLICDSAYETNDDVFMSGIAYGIYDECSNRLVFINIFLGKMILILLDLFPSIPWYGITQYLVIFISFSILTYVLIKKKDWLTGYFFSSILLIYGAFEFYLKLQFTKTAGIAAISGTILIFYGCMIQRSKWKSILLGVFMLLIGSWYRFDSCMLVLLIMSTLGVREIIKNMKKYDLIKGILQLKPYFLIFGSAMLLIFLTRILDRNIYKSDEVWDSYSEYNINRSNLLDYGFPDYNENQQEYEQLGITPNDVEMFSSWIFADPEIFTNELMKKLIALKPKKEFSTDIVFEFFKLFPYAFFKENLFLISLFLFALWSMDRKKELFAVFYLPVLILGINFYLFYKGRYLQHRVDVVIWMSVFCLLAYSVNCVTVVNRSEHKKSFLALSFLAVLFQIQPYWTNIIEKSYLIEERERQKEVCNFMGNDKKHLYYVLATDDRMSTCYLPLDMREIRSSSNVYALGGWGTQMPVTNCILTDYNVYNPFREMVNNPDMYLVSPEYPELIVNYICEHYDSNAYACLVKSYNGFDFYKVVSEDIKIHADKAIKFDQSISFEYNTNWNPDTRLFNIAGTIYKNESNIFEAELLLKIHNRISEENTCLYITGYVNEDNTDSGKYQYFEIYHDVYIEDPDAVDMELILNVEGTLYREAI